MKRILALVLAAFIPLSGALADDPPKPPAPLIQPAGEHDLSEFLWINRVIVVFADSPADPRFLDQIDFLREGEAMLRDRDVVVLTDSAPADRTPARQKLRPRGFQMALVDKDGMVKLRKPDPWTVREIAASIDKTPMRLREVEDRRRKAAEEAPAN